MKILLRMAYVGTNYCGFQRQPKNQLTKNSGITNKQPAIQNVIENALLRLYKHASNPILITASGRTDAGVHADDQPLSFVLNKKEAAYMPVEKIPSVLNKLLPPSIRALRAHEVNKDFHPRFNAKVRLYVYSLALPLPYGQTRPPNEKYYLLRKAINPKKLQKCLQILEGTHNFNAFASTQDTSRSKIRHIFKTDLLQKPGQLHVYIYGNAFLRSMVRSIIGNCIAICNAGQFQNSHYAQQEMKRLLLSQDPTLAKARVPAYGLCLKKVFYNKIF